MRPLGIDFVGGRRRSPVAWVALAAAVFVAGDSMWQARAARQQAERLEAAARQPAAAGPELPRRDPAAERERAQAELVQRRLSLPWGELFRAIESASGQRVALLAIEPDAQAGRLSIAGEASDSRAVMAYLARLSKLPHLREVHLLQHEVQEEAPQAVRFVVSAQWRGLP